MTIASTLVGATSIFALACEDRATQEFTTKQTAVRERLDLVQDVPRNAEDDANKRAELRQDITSTERDQAIDVLKVRVDALEDALEASEPSEALSQRFEAVEDDVEAQLAELDARYGEGEPAPRTRFEQDIERVRAKVETLAQIVEGERGS